MPCLELSHYKEGKYSSSSVMFFFIPLICRVLLCDFSSSFQDYFITSGAASKKFIVDFMTLDAERSKFEPF